MQTLHLARRPYAEVEAAMRAFTAARTADTEDQLWLVEHDSVFTQGIAGQDAHVLAAGSIPVVRTDRGGQVTYHGPGQVVVYPLVDLRRLSIYVKEYVFRIEAALIDTLAEYGVTGHRVAGAPGIYVRLDDPFGHAVLAPARTDPFKGLGKIAALGIKVSQHRSYHGLALNVAMDLEPFTRINPCGRVGDGAAELLQHLAVVGAATHGCVQAEPVDVGSGVQPALADGACRFEYRARGLRRRQRHAARTAEVTLLWRLGAVA